MDNMSDEEVEPTEELEPEAIDGEEPQIEDGDLEPEDLIEEDSDAALDPDALVVDIVISDEGSTIAPTDLAKPKSGDEEEDEDDLRTEDDVEADLSAILQEKLSSPQETAPEEEEEVVGDDRTDGTERLQPRRPDETQCSRCFLLVRATAPGCPQEDDLCPVFKTR